MKSEKAIDVVTNAYKKYGEFVNSFRSLPDVRDGLKVVQRRLLIAASECGASSKVVKSATLVGNTISKYHPYGDSSIYGATVSMVNQDNPVFIGQGNFGFRGYVETGAAAMRYTGVKLDPELGPLYLSLSSYVNKITNDLGNKEQEYLPTPIPYCLLNGAMGIGVGVRTNIPQITKRSLKSAVREYLTTGEITTMLRPKAIGGGELFISDDDLKLLNDYGIGSARIKAEITLEWDPIENKNAIVVGKSPIGLSYIRIRARLRDYLEEGSVFIRDESSGSPRVVIHRTPRIRKVTDEEILSRVERAMSKSIRYQCIVSNNGVAQQMGLRDILKISIDHSIKAYSTLLEDRKRVSLLHIKFLEIRKSLASRLLQDWDKEEICEHLKLTDEEYDYCIRKSINTLSNKEDSIEKERENFESIIRDIENIKTSYLTFARI